MSNPKGLFVSGAGFLALAAICGAPNQGFGQEAPLEIEPVGAWKIDYDADSCRLSRVFGDSSSHLAFHIERYEPGDSFFLLVAGRALKAKQSRKTVFAFGPNGFERETRSEEGKFGLYEPALFESSMYLADTFKSANEKSFLRSSPPSDWTKGTNILGQELTEDQEGKIHWLDIKRGRSTTVRLKLGSMERPMAALRKCTDDLVRHWGIDVEAHRTLTRPATPKNNPGRWVKSSDYPTDLLRRGAQGLVQFRLTVGESGTTTDCHIQRSTRPEGFDAAVCQALKRRSRFDPALDASGKPIKSYWRSAVRFNVGR